MENQPFPTPFAMEEAMEPKTVRELLMMRLSQDIREKERWMEKINDENILQNWKKEIKEDGKLVQFVFDELRYYAERSLNGISVGAVDGTWQADGLIDPSLKKDFIKSVYDLLENVDESQKDYHPWSKNQVVDLVHPSLFCYVKGVTKIDKLDEEIDYIEPQYVSKGVSSSVPEGAASEQKDSEKKVEENVSKYQWLPSEFHVDSEGKVSINSYINNLNPKTHEALYPLIARIFEKFVPLFNNVLTDLRNIRPNRIIMTPSYEWYAESEGDAEDERDLGDFYKDKELIWPEIPTFSAPEQENTSFDLRGKNLQVIVKLANIELRPKEPKYVGGAWHVEGVENEAIVASGIYYYSSSNITESRLLFRQGLEDPDYQQYDANGVKKVFGLNDGDPLNQEIGSIVCCEDRCISFPNIYQHKVGPFELADKTKNGHRKILVFFLVDPNKRILSTKHVSPQQRGWLGSLEEKPAVESTMTLDEARIYREKLMMTRKYEENEYDYDLEKPHRFYERKFSLCEH
ncbi:hypothetical protein JTB14_023303 [Gonioctena quinquepunctata]|nr:hypothetical protein JTB14_023303 [Gonioctena quinquepunctata]